MGNKDVIFSEQLEKLSDSYFDYYWEIIQKEKTRRDALKLINIPLMTEEEFALEKFQAIKLYRNRIGCSLMAAQGAWENKKKSKENKVCTL